MSIPPNLLVLALGLGADPAGYPNGQLLIEPPTLVKAAGQFRVLDVRPKAAYDQGHIPGAFSVDVAAWNKVLMTSPDRPKADALFTAAGLAPATRVVIYHDTAFAEAARLWWILRYHGVADVRLLNGGWLAWQKAGGPVSTAVPVPLTEPQTARPAEKDRLVTKDQMLAAVGTDRQVVDARSAGEFQGEKKTARRNGCVPGAKHLEWSELIDQSTQRVKPAPELEKLFAAAGIDPARPTVTYCQSGGRASAMMFGLELMGAKDVRNYYRSWSEWGNDDTTPITAPGAVRPK